jgi:hypothetical protein
MFRPLINVWSVFVLAALATPVGVSAQNSDIHDVSLFQLLARRSDYDGKLIRVGGHFGAASGSLKSSGGWKSTYPVPR